MIGKRALGIGRIVAGKKVVGTRGLSSLVRVSPAVKEALANNEPVVALESTIISHGMPYPQNLETAIAVEEVIRKNHAVPATVALMDGKICVGLSRGDLERLAKTGRKAVKASTRDLAVLLSKQQQHDPVLGATTVSGTMIAAKLAGIEVFVTGGIGGVHRGVQNTHDISPDLTELGRTPVSVVCGGAKSILDIPRTLEHLETLGVPVITFGSERHFPAFFTTTTHDKIASPWNVETYGGAARMIHAQRKQLKSNIGMVFAVPIPEHEQMFSGAEIEEFVGLAIDEAEENGILSGKESTPFLLQRLVELTGGKTLSSNIALIKNNAKVGANIAVEYAKLLK